MEGRGRLSAGFLRESALQGTDRPVESPAPRDESSFFSLLAEASPRQCQVVRRHGTLYVICKANPKFKARQGRTKGTRLSKKGVK